MSIPELDIDGSVRLVGEGHDEAQWRPLILQPEVLQYLDDEDGDLHLSKPPAYAAPGAVTEGDVTEGVKVPVGTL